MSWTWIPNALTLIRCALAFAVTFAVLLGGAVSHRLNAAYSEWVRAGMPAPGEAGYPEALASIRPESLLVWPAVALTAFLLAAVTDLLDGIAARALNAQSAFGAWLDPIADKLLVGLSLAALTVASGNVWLAVPSALIICRDTYITWLRARLGGGYALPVMAAAKWKTALEMIAIGVLLAAPLSVLLAPLLVGPSGLTPAQSAHMSPAANILGITLTWAAATLSAWTGLRYWRAAQEAPNDLQKTFE